jgi:RHS repeat-associated protein
MMINTTGGYDHLRYRNYDPVLGRMQGVDPKAVKYASLTPYNFAMNDPVYFNDRLGDDVVPESGYVCGHCWRNEESMRFYNLGTGAGGGGMMFSMGAVWSPGMNGVAATNLTRSEFGPSIYNNWCNCNVNAFEVVMWDPTNQRQSYRNRAQAAIDSYFNKNSDTQGGPSDRAGDYGLGLAASIVETGFVIRAGELGVIADKLSTVPHRVKAKALSDWSKTAIKGLRVGTRASGLGGTFLGLSVTGYNVYNANTQAVDIMDIAFTTVSTGVIAAVGIAAAPYVAAAAVVYGVATIAYGDSINQNWAFGNNIANSVNQFVKGK